MKKIIPLNSYNNNDSDEVKYAKMVDALYLEFKPDFAPGMEKAEAIEIICHAWNIACLSETMKLIDRDELLEIMAGTDEKSKLISGIAQAKFEKYKAYGQFIDFFDFQDQDENKELKVYLTDKEGFSEKMEAIGAQTELSESDFKEGYINRYAIRVKPKKPYIEWANACNSADELPYETSEYNTYLVHEYFDDFNLKHWIKNNYFRIFVMELFAWNENEEDWPKKRSYTLFKKWFSIEISSMVYDFETFPVFKEP